MPWFLPMRAEITRGAAAYGKSKVPTVCGSVPLAINTHIAFITSRCTRNVPNIKKSREFLAKVCGWLIQSCANAVKNTSKPNRNCLACGALLSPFVRAVP